MVVEHNGEEVSLHEVRRHLPSILDNEIGYPIHSPSLKRRVGEVLVAPVRAPTIKGSIHLTLTQFR